MITRVTAILDTFDSSQRCRSLQEIASMTGLPRSTAHRILEQLVELGWVQHAATSGYRLGWRANHMPSRANEDSQLRAVAAHHLFVLAVQTRLTIHLAVLDGPFVRYLDKIGRKSSLVPSRVGGTLPAHLTAVGRVMLASVDPERLDLMLERVRPDVDAAALHRDLALVRMRGGLSTLHRSPLAPVACIGAPVFDAEHRIAGAVSVCDAGTGEPLDRHAPVLLERARRISAKLAKVEATAGE